MLLNEWRTSSPGTVLVQLQTARGGIALLGLQRVSAQLRAGRSPHRRTVVVGDRGNFEGTYAKLGSRDKVRYGRCMRSYELLASGISYTTDSTGVRH